MLPNNDHTCGRINELPKRTGINKFEGQTSCDWLIVGAGYTGLSAARQLGNMNPNMNITGELDHMHFDSDTDDKTGKLRAGTVTDSIFDFSNTETAKPYYRQSPKIQKVKNSLFDRDHSAPRGSRWRAKKYWDKSLYIGSIEDSVFLPDVLNSHDWVRPHSSTLVVHDAISEKKIFASAAKNFFFPSVYDGKTYVAIFTTSSSKRNVIEMGEWIANHFTKDDKVGHVASINNQAEHDFLVDYVDKNAHSEKPITFICAFSLNMY